LSTATYCVLSLVRKMNCSVLKLTPLERNTKSSLTAIKRKDSNARQIEDIEFSVMLLKLLFVWELGENEIVSLSAEQEGNMGVRDVVQIPECRSLEIW